MSADAEHMNGASEPDAEPKRGGKARLLSLSDIDRRTTAYRRTNELIGAIESDLGGSEQLSTGERQIVQRAAVTGALIEDLEARWLQGDEIDPALYATLGNAQRRLFETVGLRRRPRDVTPSLAQYLATKAAAESLQPSDGAAGTNAGAGDGRTTGHASVTTGQAA